MLVLLALLPSPAALAADLAGSAIVTDGDTLKVQGVTVRLNAIDAPEGRQSCTRGGVDWLCGQQAASFLRELVAGKDLRCSEKYRDQFGRTVAQCFLPDGADVGAVLVSAGWALAYRRYGREYVGAEDKAKAEGVGLWAGEFMPPWEWRASRR